MNNTEIMELNAFCKESRRLTVRQIASLGLGHIGGSLSMVELLAVLYNKCMRVDPADPHMEGRDRLVLSKGHCGPGLYTVLAQKGFFPLDQLFTLNKPGTILPSHVDMLKDPQMGSETFAYYCSKVPSCFYFLGIDAGSTTLKCAVTDGDGRLLLTSYRSNSGDPVPIAFYTSGMIWDDAKEFSETGCSRGMIGRIRATDIVPICMDLANRTSKFGS